MRSQSFTIVFHFFYWFIETSSLTEPRSHISGTLAGHQAPRLCLSLPNTGIIEMSPNAYIFTWMWGL